MCNPKKKDKEKEHKEHKNGKQTHIIRWISCQACSYEELLVISSIFLQRHKSEIFHP